jgi:hypothetical protein
MITFLEVHYVGLKMVLKQNYWTPENPGGMAKTKRWK